MSYFLMILTYKNSLFFCGSTSSDYGFNLLSLSNVLLNTVKTYQPRSPRYILLKEVPPGFNLVCNQRQVINRTIYLLLRVWHLPSWLEVRFQCLYVVQLVDIFISMEGE